MKKNISKKQVNNKRISQIKELKLPSKDKKVKIKEILYPIFSAIIIIVITIIILAVSWEAIDLATRIRAIISAIIIGILIIVIVLFLPKIIKKIEAKKRNNEK